MAPVARVSWSLYAALVLCAAFTPLVGCGGTGASAPADTVRSELQRNTDPTVPPRDLASAVSDGRDFAVEFHKALATGGGNSFFSPYSISLALAMTYAGARGNTESEMATALRWSLPQARLHPAYDALDLDLAKRAVVPPGAQDNGLQLSIANAMWGQRGFAFVPAYLDTLAVNYGAGVQVLDFAASPDGSRRTINGWVSDRTAGKIPELLPDGFITVLTRFVLTNAIYFKSAWANPFDPGTTADGAFTTESEESATVPFMHSVGPLRYALTGDGSAVEVPYVRDLASMVVVLPAGSLREVEQQLSGERVGALLDGLATRNVRLSLPKFAYSKQASIADMLRSLGMKDAFTDLADFSGMSTQDRLRVSDVVHSAFVSVDEKGTEAGAATAVGGVGTGGPDPNVVDFTVDRPFLFLIRDTATGAVLFMGRVADPR